MTDYELATWVNVLYNTPKGRGPFSMILRENKDYGVNVGIYHTKNNEIVFAFRGSVTPEDWVRDALSYLPDEQDGMTFPLGFFEGMEQAFENLRYFLERATKVYITGHSLGSGHATIFYQLVKKYFPHLVTARVLLMGCPRLSLREEMIDQNVISFQNEEDFVCDVPTFPWGQFYPLTRINGGHDPKPSLFMYHHIEYYLKGILDYEKGV